MRHSPGPTRPDHLPCPGYLGRPGNPGWLGRAGRTCYRHRWLTLAAWMAGVACLIVLWMQFGAAANNSFTGNDPGQSILNQHFPRQSGDTLTLAIRSAQPITSPAVRDQVTGALAPFRAAPHVISVSDPYTTPGHLARDGHIAFASVQFNVTSTAIPNSEAVALMNDARAASGHGVTFSLGGDVVDQAETPYGGSSDGIGIAAAAIVLLIAFGSFLAMGLPVLTAVFGIGSGLALIALLGHVFPAPSFSPIIASMIGLGVGVDYALFIVTRFREALRGVPGGRPPGLAQRDGLHAGLNPEDATVTAMRTAGRSVLTAGTTARHRDDGPAGAARVADERRRGRRRGHGRDDRFRLAHPAARADRLHRHPAGQAVPGPAPRGLVRRSRHRSAGNSLPAAERWAGVVSRHPIVATISAAALILVLAVPALSMKLSMPDESAQASGTMGRASYVTMAEGFGPGFDAPLIVAARLPSPHASTAGLASAVAATPGIARVTPPVISPDGRAAMLIAYPATGEQDPATNALVNRIGNTVLPRATAGTGITAHLTGPNAGNVTFANMVGQRLPWLIAVVVVLSMLLLTMVFRSVTVAIKAAVMNLLSISAAYGVLVAIAQWGWGHQLFGFPEKVPVTTWVPMFLFGLSMDYKVFLLSRIREEWDRTGDNTASVARGLASTARVISAAAAIMVVVFLSFVAGADVSVKQIGLGLAVAVLIDATVVRLVLVPAVMELLGRANWWLPRPLARILPQAPAPSGEPEAPAGVMVGDSSLSSGSQAPGTLVPGGLAWPGGAAWPDRPAIALNPNKLASSIVVHMLDVARLRVLVAVARHGSVTAAARELNYAQPSVSHHLARLEAETGVKLIQRAGRGIRLTEAGRLLADRAAEVLGRLDAAENELAAQAGLRAGRVRLAAFPSALGTIVPAAAAMLRTEHPHMDLRLTEAEPPEALRMLRAGYVDVALVFRHGLPAPAGPPASGLVPVPVPGEDGTRGRLLLDEAVHLITRARTAPAATTAPGTPEGAGPAGAAGGPGATGTAGGPGRLDLARYAGHRWIAGCDRCRVNLITQCSLAGFTPKIAFTTDDYVAVQALVAAGLGVATLPDLALRAARHPAIRTAELPGSRRQVFALLYGEPPDPPATTRLIEALSAAAGSLAALAGPRAPDAPPGPRSAPGPETVTAGAARDLLTPAP